MVEQKLKKLPLGISDFKKIITGDYLYVDKTQLIYQLITTGEYYFLSRPRRFGKSLLVSTLAELFVGNRELFKNLWIEQSDYSWQMHPVIKIDFSRVDYSSIKRLEKSLSKQLYSIAKKYHVIVEKTDSVKDLFDDLIQALATINTVVILIDEYDKPILDYVHDPIQANVRRDILRNFYLVIKASDQLIRFAFLTGVTKFSKTSIFSGLNNLEDISLDEEYAMFLGYTNEELNNYFVPYIKVLAQKDVKNSSNIIGELRRYYDGYSFARNSLPVFNPYSVLSCLKKKSWANYWFESGTPTFLIKLLKTGNYSLDRIYQPIMSANELGAFEPSDIKITALLYQAGYLTITNYNKDTKDYTLDFPNHEVASAFNLLISTSFTQLTENQTKTYAALIAQAFVKQDLEKLKKLLQNFFNEMPYNVHISREFDLQIIIFSVFKLIGIEVDPEVATSLGRADLVVSLPKLVYVIELKFNKTAHEALVQIQDKKYYEKYLSSDKQITLVGINFESETKTVSLESQNI